MGMFDNELALDPESLVDLCEKVLIGLFFMKHNVCATLLAHNESRLFSIK